MMVGIWIMVTTYSISSLCCGVVCCLLRFLIDCLPRYSSSAQSCLYLDDFLMRRQEELLRSPKAAGRAKQGQWLNWEGAEKRKLNWRNLWKKVGLNF